MRSDFSAIDQQIMCMQKVCTVDQNGMLNTTAIKTEDNLPDLGTYPISSSENSVISYDENDIIEFGPIKVKPRKKPAPTLATGRRSKYERLNPEEEQKRDLRRARNRAAAERVRLSRLNVEKQLRNQVDLLENQEKQLRENVQKLQRQKLELEARILTHTKLCSVRTTLNRQTNHTCTYNSHQRSASISTYPTTEALNFDFDDLFSDSLSSLQIQQTTYSNSLPNRALIDDFEELFNNS